MNTTPRERICIDCGRPLMATTKGRPTLRCGECKRGRRRVKVRAQATCKDCGTKFDPPAHTGKPPSRCESCRIEHKRIAGKERTAAWREANRDRQRKYDREYQAKRRLDPEFRQRRNEFEMIRKYGITMAEFEERLTNQGGACAICGGPPNGPGARFHVDHHHESKKVRGLLCGKCNTAIGLLNDDPDLAERVAAYLRM